MIIGLLGRAGSGKSMAAKHIVETRGGRIFSLAEPLKAIARDVFDFSHEQLYGTQAQKEATDPRYGFSARWLLQRLGTEGCRRHLGDDVWVRATLRAIESWRVESYDAPTFLGGPSMSDAAELAVGTGYKGLGIAVIDDVRFVNEAKLLTEAGARIIKLVCEDDEVARAERRCRHCGIVEEHHQSNFHEWEPLPVHASEAEVDLVPENLLYATISGRRTPGSADLKAKIDAVLGSMP